MSMKTNTGKMMRGITLSLIAGAVWLAGSLAIPTDALAGSCNANSNANSSVITDFTSASLVCGSRATASSTLGLDAASGAASGKATICHIPPGNAAAQHTITVSQSAVHAHMAHGDTMGPCSGWVTEAYVDSLPTCTLIEGSTVVVGVWIPDNAIGDGASLNAYFEQVQSGQLSGLPDASSQSYREIKSQ